jgi:hypothetical protein
MSETVAADDDPDVQRAIASTISKLGTIERGASVSFALQVGATIVEQMFHGNSAQLRRRGPKDLSLRRLARHPDLPMTARSLYLAVGIYELCGRLGQDPSLLRLDISHFEAVLPAPRAQQTALLLQAAADRWTVRRLREKVAAMALPRRGGPRRQSFVVRSARSVERAIGELDHLLSSTARLDLYDLEQLHAVSLRMERAIHAIGVARRSLTPRP